MNPDDLHYTQEPRVGPHRRRRRARSASPTTPRRSSARSSTSSCPRSATSSTPTRSSAPSSRSRRSRSSSSPRLGRGRRGQQGGGRRARHRQRRPVRRRLARQDQALDGRGDRQAHVGRGLREVRPARKRQAKVKFLPTSDADRRRDARRRSASSSVDDLFASIPREVRQAPDLPPPLSEIEMRRVLGRPRREERERPRDGVLPRRRPLPPLRLGDRRPDALPRRSG